VLVADDLGPLPATIRSRCQHVPFRRLSERAVRAAILAKAPDLAPEQATALARVAGGRFDRAERLLEEETARRRATLLDVARRVYADPAFDASAAAAELLALASERGAEARARAEEELETLDLPPREAELRLRRAERGAEREEVLDALEELAAWYRDLVAVAVGAERAVIHFDRLAELTEDAGVERLAAAERAAEAVRETWRSFEEFNVNAGLALEALFITLRDELAGSASPV
jgi:DNA polymerase-3 subunit delta'